MNTMSTIKDSIEDWMNGLQKKGMMNRSLLLQCQRSRAANFFKAIPIGNGLELCIAV